MVFFPTELHLASMHIYGPYCTLGENENLRNNDCASEMRIGSQK